MPYKKATDILPSHLIEAIQDYVDGGLLYFPKKSKRINWGDQSGSREVLLRRNEEIINRREMGESIADLARAYFLSEERIRKILKNRPK